MKTLRIIFTLLSAVCLVLVIPCFTLFGFVWGGVCAALGFLFFMIMRIFKQEQEFREGRKENGSNAQSKPTDKESEKQEKQD